jgi:dolichyl-phosphate-mannose-protein mannosyltransferase
MVRSPAACARTRLLPERDLVTGSTTASATSGTEDGADVPSPRRGERVAGGVVVALVVLLGVLAAVLATGSFASYASVKRHLDSFASDGDANLTPAEFDAIVVRLRIAAALAVLAAIAVAVGRHRLRRFLVELASQTGAAAVALWHGLVRAIAMESWLHLATLGLLTVAAVLVRLDFLFQPMRYDESVTYVHYASRPWYIALTTYTAPNNHVLHSLLVHFSTVLFGGEPWAIRLPAFVAGILLVPASYVAGRAFYGKHAALVGAALVAGSSVIVEYSTNARGYTLLAVVFVLLLALATRLATSWSLGEWLAFSVLAAIGFFTVPVMLYGVGAVAVWLVLSFPSGERWRLLLRRLLPSVVLALVLSAVLYLPIVAASGLSSLVRNDFVESLPWSVFTDELPDSLASTWRGWHRDSPLPLDVMLTAGFLVALVLHRRLSRFAWPPAVAAMVWIVPVVVVQRVAPFERVWLFLLPLYLITAAAGIVFALRPLVTRIASEAVVAIVLAIVLAGALGGNAVATQSVYDSEDTSTFRDGDQVAGLLTTILRPGDKVLVAPPVDAILEYQLLRRGLEPASLLYWDSPGSTRRFIAVVKDAPGNYGLDHLLADPRLDDARFAAPHLLRRYDAARVYDLTRVG